MHGWRGKVCSSGDNGLRGEDCGAAILGRRARHRSFRDMRPREYSEAAPLESATDAGRIRLVGDSLGWRAKFGVLAPSTNTSVQPEFDAMRPRGVTNHHSRLVIPDSRVSDDASFLRMMGNIRRALFPALEAVLTCDP